MMLFDLKCSNSHIFEAWFKDSKEYARQSNKGLINCPICDDNIVTKSLMSPNVSKKSNSKNNKKIINKTLVNKISKFKKMVEKNFEYVGNSFTEEAKKIKYGESEERSIYGEANLEQTKELIEEEIDFQPLPWTSDKKAN
ncbi:MAG: hypothetical protein CFH21_00296 [Alphaproteobacteria bacterium MarineAlpha5_Bin11]|nr:hypothetical protein [Pelagibacteraceae bacterium]PPR44516.1 MAG: hypothetical protein CFH21_00296 [Alphaproteobacteria bacterium MarineAlpha5_Bin11]|tara:strand:+ start:488 stop:907 length:420 start_codon:yes stop_codon:yes gene_type:complete